MTIEAEVGVLRGDIARLLRLLDYYPAAHDFLERWHDSDGMSFLGLPPPKQITNSISDINTINRSISSSNNPLGMLLILFFIRYSNHLHHKIYILHGNWVSLL